MKNKNRVIILLVLLILLIACTSGAKKTDTENGTIAERLLSKVGGLFTKGTPDEDTKEEPAIIQEAPVVADETEEMLSSELYALGKNVTVPESVIYDKDGIKVTVKSLDYDGWMGVELKYLAENESGKSVILQAADLVINGFVLDPVMSTDLPSGEKVNSALTIMAEDLETAGIETIQYLEFNLRIIDSDDWSKSFNTDRIRVETNADPAFAQKVDDSGDLLFEQDGIRVIMKELDTEASYFAAELIVLVENNSGRDISLTVRDVSVNGFEVNPIFYVDLLSGTRAYTELIFLEEDLKSHGIVDFKEIELYFSAIDKNEWNTIFETEMIKLRFD